MEGDDANLQRSFLNTCVNNRLADITKREVAHTQPKVYSNGPTVSLMKILERHFDNLHPLLIRLNKLATLQLDIMKNKIPLLDMTWSVKYINTFLQHPLIYSLMTYDTQYNNREMEYIDHNYSSDDSSL